MAGKVVVRVAFGVALAVSACSVDTSSDGVAGEGEEVSSIEQGLTITRHDATTFEGTFVDAQTTIRFLAFAPTDERAELSFTLNGKALHYEALAATSAHDGYFRVNAELAFDAQDKRGAQAALDALVDVLGEDVTAMSLFEASVPKMAYFIANQADGQLVGSLSRNEYSTGSRPKSLNDDGLVCIKKTTTVTAYYDNAAGAATSYGVVVGSDWGTSACGSGNYSCMGRCGAGCSGFGGGWTQDCLEHDACSHDLCASGGGSDANCGDEYNHASSDIFSSCSGN